MKKIIFFILLLFLTHCGFSSIYLSNENSVIQSIYEIKSAGDKNLNKKLINNLNISTKTGNSYSLEINSSKNKVSTSKNSANVTTGYMMTIDVGVKIYKNNLIQKNKKISKSFTYNNRDNKFELLNYERSVENNLINDISDEIFLFLNLTNDN